MKFEEYRSLDATTQATLIRKKEVTATELLELAIARVEAVNGPLNAVVLKLYDEARRQASGPLGEGPFAGVPFLIKDLDVQLKGTKYTAGTRLLKDYVSAESSEVVNRIQRSGLIIFGKTNTPEFGLTPYTEGKLLGTCHNPWNTAHTTGGSSGGSGSAVAAGIVPMALASDGGGSIRIPASCCGIFGIKPSRGRVSNGPLYGQMWEGAVTSGIVSRSVRDAAAYIDVVQGAVDGDPYVIQAPERPYTEEVKLPAGKLRIGYSYQMPKGFDFPIDPENIKAIEMTVKLLRSLGHEVEEIELPFDKTLHTHLLYTLVMSHTSALIDYISELRGRKAQVDEVEPNTWLMYKLGKKFTAADAAGASLRWNKVARAMGDFHRRYDMLLTPTLGRKPFQTGALQSSAAEESALKLLNSLGISAIVKYTGLIEKIATNIYSWIPYPPLANITGQPSMTVPLHWSEDGLPVGVMFTARMNDEAGLFRLAAQLEQAQPWFDRVPPEIS
jgi:amidase